MQLKNASFNTANIEKSDSTYVYWKKFSVFLGEKIAIGLGWKKLQLENSWPMTLEEFEEGEKNLKIRSFLCFLFCYHFGRFKLLLVSSSPVSSQVKSVCYVCTDEWVDSLS